jgi:hypothetical protein
MTTNRKPRAKLPLALGLLFLAAVLGAAVPSAVRAAAYGDGRSESGARLFRAMLAADVDLEKKLDAEGALGIAIVHTGDVDRAKALGDLVARRDAKRPSEAIKGLPVRIDIVRVEELQTTGPRAVAAVFIAEPLRREAIDALVRFGVERRVIIYSPFEGDVEQGVAGGLSIEAQVRPFVNTAALRAAQVTLKEFFLKVAKAYP